MPGQPDQFRRGGGGKSHEMYRRQVPPGLGGEPPSSPQIPLDPRERIGPGTPAAEQLSQITRDPWAREELQLMLEEALRNFFVHTAPSPIMMPPYAALAGPGRMILEVASDVATADGVWRDVVSGEVEKALIGVLASMGQGVTDSAAWDNVTWRLITRQRGMAEATVQELPIDPYTGFQHQLGQVDLPTWIRAVIWGPATWALQVQSGDGHDYTVVGRIDGWKFPGAGQGKDLGAMIVD